VPQIGRRARRRERSGVPGFMMAARVRRTRPMHRAHRRGGPRVRILLPPPASLRTLGPLPEGELPERTGLSRGTEGSNPSPSSAESSANLTFGCESYPSREDKAAIRPC
jgi:hypothetical protein